MPTTSDLLTEATRLMLDAPEMEPDAFDAALAAWIGDSADKAERIAAVRAAAVDRADAAKRRAEEHAAVRKRNEAVAERCGHLMHAILVTRRELGEDAKIPGVARLQRNGGKAPLLGTPDPAALPDSLVKIERKPDNEAIRAALASGIVVPGVTLGEVAESVRWE